MPNWKKVILSGSNAVLAEITASRNLSGSGTATASYGLFTGSFGGDGSQLTNVPSTPFPFTGDALITGSLIVSQSYTVGDTDSTALRLIGSGSVSQSGIFEVEGSAGPLFSVADGLDGVLMEVNNISGLPLFQVSSSNEVFINRGNLTSGVTTATASFAYFTGSFAGDASGLTNVPAGSTPTLQQVTTAGATTTNDIQITGSLLLSGSLQLDYNGGGNMIIGSGSGEALTTGTNNIIFGNNAAIGLDTGTDNIIIGHNSAGDSDIDDGANLIIIGKDAASNATFSAEDDSVVIGTEAGKRSDLEDCVLIGAGAGRLQNYPNTNTRSVGIGYHALYDAPGDDNVAIGYNALTKGYPSAALSKNVAIGNYALEGNSQYTISNENIAIGYGTLREVGTQGDQNIAIGFEAMGYGSGIRAKKNIVIGYHAGYNLYSVDATHNIIIGPSASLAFTGSSHQLVIASGSSHLISGSFATGDIIFYNTASAPNFSGSFQGDGSQLTNLPAGSTPTLDAVTTQGNVTSNAITAGTISGSSFKLNNANALSHTGNVLYVGNSNDWTTVELGRETTDEIHVNGLLKAEQLLRAEQSAEITGSLIISGSGGAKFIVDNVVDIETGIFYGLGKGVPALNNGNHTNILVGNDITGKGDYGSVVIGTSAGASNSHHSQVVIGRNANSVSSYAVAVGNASEVNDFYGISIGHNAGNDSNTKGINIGGNAKGKGEKGIVISSIGDTNISPTKANTFGIYMTDASPNFEIEATGSSTLSGSSFTIEKSGSTVFEVIGSEGTLFSVDDDLDGTIFTANDRSGLPVLEASASGEVYIGKAPQSLYTTAVISSNNANVTQSIYGLDTSSYGGAFFEYTAHSGSNARAGSIMSVWNGSSLNFTETTTTDIGSTSDLVMKVHISESQAQLAAFSTNAGYNIKTIIKSI